MSWGEIKKAINSTLGTSGFLPLDKLIQYNIDKANGNDVVEFKDSGTYTAHIPVWANRVRITAAAGGGGGYANSGGGGGGGAAILNNIYTISDALKNTNISVTVGSGGAGAKYVYEDDAAVRQGPYDGENTTINAFGITLNGGKAGTSSSGGAAGGSGGGAGGYDRAGSAGISGSGGTGGTYTSSRGRYGGGGGSLGTGGNGVRSSSGQVYATNGSRGGGGGGCYSTSSDDLTHGGAGGTGYVKFEWLL
uniref:Glycine-rich domain-containing protein n=1 Tax=Phage sp. ctPjm15 TaxID=2828006 RepID=A0A8S5SR14_9VIRU|nr:MAG TPA: hypothetical protein [Phage sp. ctPjm15]